MKNKYKYILIGLLVIITVSIFFFGLNYLKGKNYFIDEDKYYVVYSSIEGLTPSSPVLLNGYNIGQVRDIRFNNLQKGNLIVEFVVKKNIKIPQNSVARIFSQDLMGTKAIELVFSGNKNKHTSGDTLIAKTEESLKEQVSIEMLPLKNKAEDLLREMESAIKIINHIFNERTRDNLKQIIEELQYTSVHLNSTTASVDSILINEKHRIHRLLANLESITRNFSKSNENVTALLANMEKLSDSLSQVDFNGTANQIDSSLIAFNTILDKVENKEGTLGRLIYDDSLYNTLNRSTDDIGELAQDLRVNPKRYLHFSVFDLGRTMYKLDEEKMREKANKNSGFYTVLLKKSKKPIALSSYKKIDNVKEYIIDDTYLYIVGRYSKKRKAARFYNKINKNEATAQLIFINNSEYTIVE